MVFRRALLCLALSPVAAVSVTAVALATHPRPGGGTPFRVPLVPAFNKCGGAATADDPAPATPNMTHISPLAAPSCSPPVRKSSLVSVGFASVGFLRFTVVSGGADVAISSSITDVRSGSPSGPDYDPPPSQPDEWLDFQPAWSPDGTKIAFSSDRDNPGGQGYEIYAMNADGSSQARLTNFVEGDKNESPDWSPDGSKIVYERVSQGIWVMNADGSGQTELTGPTIDDRDPVWSPSGTKIAFMRAGVGVYTMNPDGTGQTQISSTAGSCAGAPDEHLAWSPDGTKLAFLGVGLGGDTDIYVVNANGTGETNITNFAKADCSPSWSPDGSEIAFYTFRDSTEIAEVEIYKVNSDGTGPQTNLTATAGSDAYPTWSPDGTKILYTRTGISGDVWSMNPDGTGKANLSNSAEGDAWPDWSASGAKIAFESDRHGAREIYTMNANGTGQTRLAEANFDGTLSALVALRVTDHGNGCGPSCAGTLVDFSLPIPITCVTTIGGVGSSCNAATTVNAILPGVVTAGMRAVWATPDFRIMDFGADNLAFTGDENTFLKGGVFAP